MACSYFLLPFHLSHVSISLVCVGGVVVCVHGACLKSVADPPPLPPTSMSPENFVRDDSSPSAPTEENEGGRYVLLILRGTIVDRTKYCQ